ncbi:SRPBCC domain-containing protein [Spongiactinospora sp. TRM90649]|uniref:SRPBCC family protein n=1 Tax=Spongiactinospora sp. TRM90649 TaxID=3031114 RepID=UPI0023F7D44B|nr:SRPBCC domain-containing protein [Spongiactinospora sp. TRM90649]MDF5754612.1 SRPBCC domain-containing protein [Spongiactinospora sp. TRM90649]
MDRIETFHELKGRRHCGAGARAHAHARPLRDRAIIYLLFGTGLRRGRTEIEPGEGGTNSLDMMDAMGFVKKSTITAWDPGKRLAFREHSPDGTFSAVEYLLEGRDGGSTVLRFVHSGILGDNWDAEYYDSLKAGDLMYLRQLATYLKHFRGRHATRNLFLAGPAMPDNERVWSRSAAALSLTGEITQGAPVRLNVPGLPATDGVVEFLGTPYFAGVRTPHSIHLLVKGYRDTLVVGYHGFSDDEDEKEIEPAWRSWLASAAV